jgi:hypothetical protein
VSSQSKDPYAIAASYMLNLLPDLLKANLCIYSSVHGSCLRLCVSFPAVKPSRLRTPLLSHDAPDLLRLRYQGHLRQDVRLEEQDAVHQGCRSFPARRRASFSPPFFLLNPFPSSLSVRNSASGACPLLNADIAFSLDVHSPLRKEWETVSEGTVEEKTRDEG